MPAAVSVFGLVSALLNGMMHVIIMLVKERKTTNGNGHHGDGFAAEMRFQILKNDIKGVKDELNRVESAIKDVADRAEDIDRSLLKLSAGRR